MYWSKPLANAAAWRRRICFQEGMASTSAASSRSAIVSGTPLGSALETSASAASSATGSAASGCWMRCSCPLDSVPSKPPKTHATAPASCSAAVPAVGRAASGGPGMDVGPVAARPWRHSCGGPWGLHWAGRQVRVARSRMWRSPSTSPFAWPPETSRQVRMAAAAWELLALGMGPPQCACLHVVVSTSNSQTSSSNPLAELPPITTRMSFQWPQSQYRHTIPT
mmetsp:Transcript_10105/g.30229  ORF Transcript_10105/g.30229 Transcript_10105/m.30229 type:complete len:224 (+) Transcript_10105:632-1303(+)